MKANRILAALAVIGLSQSALAGTAMAEDEDWVEVVSAENDVSRHWIDVNSIKRKGDIVTYRERAEINDDENDWEMAHVTSRMNCKTSQVHPDLFEITFEDGKTETFKNPDSNVWNQIRPDTVGADIRDFVCKE